MRYMIHSSPQRQWYVDEYLIPSMVEQGIDRNDITVWCDTEEKGNLQACMESFKWCGENYMHGTWHIQDDVIISRKFAKLTKQYNYGIVCGVVIQNWGPDYTKTGEQPVNQLWYSFQCIRIPDKLAGECAQWFFEKAMKRKDPEYRKRIRQKKHDDDFFLYFMKEKHAKDKIINLRPNIVDHIDYILGGSLINTNRQRKVNRAVYWEDEDLVEKLEEEIKRRNNSGE